MSIATKSGDSGMTSLYGGRRVAKDNLRIEMCGLVDEVSSFLGLAKSLSKSKKKKFFIRDIQRDLYLIAAEVATPLSKVSALKEPIKVGSLKKLDSYIVYQEKKIACRQSCFVLTGENPLSSIFDICRSITRRLERRAVTALRKKMIKNKTILVYLNRLSDALYLLARAS